MQPTWGDDVEVFSEDWQFQVADSRSALVFDWDDQAQGSDVAVGHDVVSIGTMTASGSVGVRVEAWESRPQLDVAPADHIIEASVEILSGKVSVTSVSTDLELPSRLNPGWYRVRAAGEQLALGAGGDATKDGGDRYLIQLWPEPPSPLLALKAWLLWPQGMGDSPTDRPGS